MKFIFIKYFPSYETQNLQSSALAPDVFFWKISDNTKLQLCDNYLCTHQALEVCRQSR